MSGPPPVVRAAPERRDAIDVARVLALLVVVLGHLLMAVIDRRDGEIRGANLLALHPGWVFVAALAPMPVFFAAGGWANATATLTTSLGRLRTLVGLSAVVVCAWSAGVILAIVITGDAGVVGDGARVATQPLWFVAAYVPLAAAGGWLARLAAERIVGVVGVSLALLAALDLARFALDAPEWIGWPGFYLAWGTPWLLGGWWRARHLDNGLDERRVGWALALGGAAGCAALVVVAGYEPALIDAVPGARSNTTPPTLYTAVAAIAQVGIFMVAGQALDRAGRRWRRWWDRAGEAAIGIYAWHLTALTLCAAVIAAGFPVPERLTPTWWLTRPLWWAVVLTLTAGFVAATAAGRSRLRAARPTSESGRRTGRSGVNVAGVAAAATAAAVVGLRGPRSVELALVCSALFLLAWAGLRAESR